MSELLKQVDGATGLFITTITGMTMIVRGAVKRHADTYYCGGSSWPEEIVTAVLRGDPEAHQEEVDRLTKQHA